MGFILVFVLAVLCISAVNVGVHVSFWVMVFHNRDPRVDIKILGLSLSKFLVLAYRGCPFSGLLPISTSTALVGGGFHHLPILSIIYCLQIVRMAILSDWIWLLVILTAIPPVIIRVAEHPVFLLTGFYVGFFFFLYSLKGWEWNLPVSTGFLKGDDATPSSCPQGIDFGNNSLNRQAPEVRTINFQRAKPRILISTPLSLLWKTITQNDPWTPMFTAVVPLIAKTQTPEKFHRLNLKEMWYRYLMGHYSYFKNRNWNYEFMPTVPTWMDYGGEITIWSQHQMKKIADHVPSRENV